MPGSPFPSLSWHGQSESQGFLPLSRPAWGLKLNSRREKFQQQENFVCLVIVGWTNGGKGTLGQSDKSQRGKRATESPSQALAPQFHCTAAISAASLEKSQGAVQ